MKLHARILLLAAVAACLGDTLEAALVKGSARLLDSRESSVRKRKDFSGVVVWLEPKEPLADYRPKGSTIVQRDKQFIPRVQAVEVGSTVRFPNQDPIFHNAFSNFNGKVFDVGLYPPGTRRSIRMDREGVIRIFCNIHSQMSAVLVAVRTPYHAVTNREGGFDIGDVAPGEYRLRVFHERATAESLEKLERTIVVGAEPVELPDLPISEKGYLTAPRKNKYNREYADPDDRVLYPGVR